MFTIDWNTRIIHIPRTYLNQISSGPDVYELDLYQFHLDLRDREDDPDGMRNPVTHRHVTETQMGGTTFARIIEINNGYTVEFEDGQYAVNLVGANSNVADVAVVNQVSIRSQNSGGLVVLSGQMGLTQEEHDALIQARDHARAANSQTQSP